MSCQDKIKNRCKKVYAKCVAYESTVPEWSGLVDEECLDIEQVVDDLYEIVGEIKEEIDVSEVTSECQTVPTTKTVKAFIQFLLDRDCAQQELIDTMQETITQMQADISDLQENICD